MDQEHSLKYATQGCNNAVHSAPVLMCTTVRVAYLQSGIPLALHALAKSNTGDDQRVLKEQYKEKLKNCNESFNWATHLFSIKQVTCLNPDTTSIFPLIQGVALLKMT